MIKLQVFAWRRLKVEDKTLLNCFKENKVTLEPWQTKYYAIEFKGEEDKTLFKVFLKDD